nr:DUF5320 domain-containing protein [Bacteroidota bacterium]
MKDIVTLVSGIEFKSREIVNHLNNVEHEIVLLKEENKLLKEELETIKQNNKELSYRNQIIKITKVFEGSHGKTQAKARINDILREIDKCIGLLND